MQHTPAATFRATSAAKLPPTPQGGLILTKTMSPNEFFLLSVALPCNSDKKKSEHMDHSAQNSGMAFDFISTSAH